MKNKPLENVEIIITRPEHEAQRLSNELRELGAKTHIFPSIEIKANEDIEKYHQLLSDLSKYDWIIFTSASGVNYFFKEITKLGISFKQQNAIKIAAVGPATAAELHKHNLKENFQPTQFETKAIGEEIPIKQGEKILLPRADIAPPLLSEILIKRGGQVTEIPIYKTVYSAEGNAELKELIIQKSHLYVTFTSASSVRGFIVKINDIELENKVKSYTVIAIGPVTAQEAKKLGFKKIITAKTYTVEGLVEALKNYAIS